LIPTNTIRLVFAKFRELGSARQVFQWLRSADVKMPVFSRNVDVCKLVWKAPAYHSVMQILHNPLYVGAYAFGRTAQQTRIVDGRARKEHKEERGVLSKWDNDLRQSYRTLAQAAGVSELDLHLLSWTFTLIPQETRAPVQEDGTLFIR
jgi:hypothetical protein